MLYHHGCIVKYLLIAAVLVCGLVSFVIAQLAVNLPCRAAPYRSLLPLLDYNFHFLPAHPIFGNSSWWRGRQDAYLHFFLSSFYRLSKVSCGPRLLAGPARRFSSPPASRGGRPVAAGTIGKQRLKMYFLVPSSSLTSKHSKRARKNIVGPQFLLTMTSIAVAPRFPPLKFDKTKKL